MSTLSHLDSRGQAAMVDVGSKPVTRRYARAWGRLNLASETLAMITAQGFAKGDVFGAARLAGIMAAKRAGELIPLCHPLPLSWAGVELIPLASRSAIVIVAEASLAGQTGIEMEALTAVSIAGLTVYDMCKAVDKSMVLSEVALLEKKGGRSGHYFAEERSCLFSEVVETELENKNLVFWRSLGAGELEFRLHESDGPFLGRVVCGQANRLIGVLADSDDVVVVLGEALLCLQTAAKNRLTDSGVLQVVKPGSLVGEALFAVLN
ncbi:MAG: cyclic pyranopterin monophosphate synthase MoaC [Deltaproteobacteria bacterium]|nr:cyclic pyranopterin monophosphate synthase MoaC [Candidatus Tharpella sp.]